MTTTNSTFPFKKETNHETYPTSVKWHHGSSKYEIYQATLDNIEIEALLPHCVTTAAKIKKEVSTPTHVGPSLFKVFPRTLSIPLTTIWDHIVENIEDKTPENFDAAMTDFIAAHASEDDRHDLVQQLTHPVKPMNVPVQTFYYRLLELNEYVHWLPGEDAPLTPAQIKQALYDGMPKTWKERFVNSGMRFNQKTTAEICRYFRNQEQQAIFKQKQNADEQRTASRRKRRRGNNADDVKPGPAKFSGKRKPGESTRIADDTPCPIHPGSKHTWSECRLNAANVPHPKIHKQILYVNECTSQSVTHSGCFPQ
mmetsp:Transcript_24155/g.44923  ORF Transcript_24155/g.44923 Transcript_24155/m.44923 type:complete len:311 (+) Transcript_24155:28-960(+)